MKMTEHLNTAYFISPSPSPYLLHSEAIPLKLHKHRNRKSHENHVPRQAHTRNNPLQNQGFLAESVPPF